jgi:hypothetical protein
MYIRTKDKEMGWPHGKKAFSITNPDKIIKYAAMRCILECFFAIPHSQQKRGQFLLNEHAIEEGS